MDKNTIRKFTIFTLLGLVYFSAGKFGLSLAEVNPSISTVWAPTGIALAAFLYYGYKTYWPAILLGAFFVNYTTTNDFISSFLIASGNTLEGIAGAYLINRFASGRFFYNHSIDVKKFIFFTALATSISATVGVLALTISNFDSWNGVGLAWLSWWLGDVTGAIIITPLLLLLFDRELKPFNTRQILERILFVICLIVVSIVVFGNVFKNHPLSFLLIPILVWPGIRFSQKESALATFIVACIAIGSTVGGSGPFQEVYPSDTLFMLQAYLGVISLTTLIMAANVSEKNASKVKLAEAYDLALEGWSSALDLRDKETEGHSRRVADLSVRLGKELGLNEIELVNLRRGALLHDIGKMAIPDDILFKKGPLNEDEWDIMRKHPIHGSEFLTHMSYFNAAKVIPYCHHERWDGKGYPRGLKGEEIPLTARIFAIVDVWDAMRSNRPYRQALPDEEAIEHMTSLSGVYFDPKLLKIFMGLVAKENELISTESVVQTSDVKNYSPS